MTVTGLAVPGKNISLIHLALNPQTGPWSVMRDLALAQAASGRYNRVAIAVIHDSTWPQSYRDEAARTGLPVFFSQTPKMFGTASFLCQRLKAPPIREWVLKVIETQRQGHVIVHFHNAWMSGVFLPLAMCSYTAR